MAYLGSHTGHGADHTARLLISCPDGPGIVAAVSRFLFEQGANIVSSDQYSTDPQHGSFFMRSTFYLPAIDEDRGAFEEAFGAVAEHFAMRWRIAYARDRRRVALMASRADHCLLDLLWRNSRGELDMDVLCVISNHEDVRRDVEALGVRFVHIPVKRETKPQAEQRALDELAGRAELLVLARYMQILSGDFLARVGCPVINIHHSFLPAFAGAEPYRHAYERGVKLIGATAHYVTSDLDEGPIIEQDVEPISHRDTPEDLVRKGRDIERRVLSRALAHHLEDRVLLNSGKTVVFSG
jgi:formyltetrahydrofolate deformylase